MPNSTANYPFEHKLFEAAAGLSVKLSGELRTYLMVFDEHGRLCHIFFERSESTWFEEVDQLRIEHRPHIFFDPFNVPEQTWMSWQGIHRDIMERLMEVRFQASDFDSISSVPASVKAQKPKDFPNVWEVMF